MKKPPDDITPPELARLSVETFILDRVTIEAPDPLQGILARRAGAFVTLRIGKALRGCIGTITPTRSNVALEIIQNAVSAATDDPRFLPVSRSELPGLSYGVDVLSPPEEVRGLEDLDPQKFGVIITAVDGRRRALLLPRIEGIETADHQWEAVHMKAGIKPGTPVRTERFEVTRFGKD